MKTMVVAPEFIDQTPIDELVPYENNPRTHSAIQLERLVNSLKEFGFTNPILIDEDNNVIAGHGRFKRQ
jgi:ParB family transcriptional regulator, chromosome partitioning protein